MGATLDGSAAVGHGRITTMLLVRRATCTEAQKALGDGLTRAVQPRANGGNTYFLIKYRIEYAINLYKIEIRVTSLGGEEPGLKLISFWIAL